MKTFILLLFIAAAGSLFSQQPGIYVSDAGNFSNPPWKIFKYDEMGENLVVFTEDSLAWPQDILFLEGENKVLISNFNSGKINIHDANSGDYIGLFADGLGAPTRMKIGPDTLLYVLQWAGNQKVKRFELNGTFVDDFSSVGVSKSIGLDWDENEHLYVSSYDGGFVQRFDENGIDQGYFINSNLVGPTNIQFEDNGDLIILDYLDGSAKRFESNGNYIGVFMSGLNNPEGITKNSDGHYLIGNGGTGAVKLFDENGVFIEDVVSANLGGLIRPNAVVIKKDSTLNLPDITTEKFKIYPTSGSKFYLLYGTSFKGKVKVFNVQGQLIYRSRVSDSNIWDAREFASGVYIIHAIEDNGEIINEKVIVSHDQ